MIRRTVWRRAMYHKGAFWLAEPLDLPDDSPVLVAIEPADSGRWLAMPTIPLRALAAARTTLGWAFPAWVARVATLEIALAVGVVLIYLFTRLYALERYPIFFFSDEAYPVVRADELIQHGLRDSNGQFLPVYFERAGQRWMPLGNIYAHILPVLFFGKTIIVTRATSAVVSLLGPLAVALVLKFIFKSPFWWTGGLVMGMVPAWFLHSRTAFEAVIMTAFFACFLLAYLLYRCRSPRFLYVALPLGAATFYSYSNGQMVMAGMAGLLLASDLRYHLRHLRVLLVAALLALPLAAPAIGFTLEHGGALGEHLRTIDSYWAYPIPLGEKIARYATTFLYGLSPQFWFLPNPNELDRHRMDGLAQFPTVLLPFIVLGLVLCLREWRSSAHRAIVLACLAAPVGAALATIGITRAMAFIVPASILAALGINFVLQRLSQHLGQPAVGVAAFGVLAVSNLALLLAGLADGPVWSRDYGLYGMQYGAKQLFADEIVPRLASDSTTMFLVTPVWANDADSLANFFIPAGQRSRVMFASVDLLMLERRTSSDDTVVVMTRAEFEQAQQSGKFKPIQIERVISYPDGTPGFYLTRLAYVDDIDAIWAAEREARKALVEGEVEISGQRVTVLHPLFDSGTVKDMFDGDENTLARVMEANPAIFDFRFSKPIRLSQVWGAFGGHDLNWSFELYGPGDEEPVQYSAEFVNNPPIPRLEVAFDRGPSEVDRVRFALKDLRSGEIAKIHVRELQFR